MIHDQHEIFGDPSLKRNQNFKNLPAHTHLPRDGQLFFALLDSPGKKVDECFQHVVAAELMMKSPKKVAHGVGVSGQRRHLHDAGAKGIVAIIVLQLELQPHLDENLGE